MHSILARIFFTYLSNKNTQKFTIMCKNSCLVGYVPGLSIWQWAELTSANPEFTLVLPGGGDFICILDEMKLLPIRLIETFTLKTSYKLFSKRRIFFWAPSKIGAELLRGRKLAPAKPAMGLPSFSCSSNNRENLREKLFFSNGCGAETWVARWFVFKPKIPIWIHFEGS
jgi:hypothetical protein